MATHLKRLETKGRGYRDGGEGEGELKKADRMTHDWMIVLMISVLFISMLFLIHTK